MKLKRYGLVFFVLMSNAIYGYSICNDPPPAHAFHIGWAKAASGPRLITYKIENTSSWTADELAEIRAAFAEWDSAAVRRQLVAEILNGSLKQITPRRASLLLAAKPIL